MRPNMPQLKVESQIILNYIENNEREQWLQNAADCMPGDTRQEAAQESLAQLLTNRFQIIAQQAQWSKALAERALSLVEWELVADVLIEEAIDLELIPA